MDYTKEVVDSIKPILKDYGFKKKGLNWFWEDQDIIKIFNIQRSQFSRKIYLNIGIKIKTLEAALTYTFPGAHIGFRLDHLIKEKYLDFESGMDSNSRNLGFAKLINSNPYQFFTFTGNLENIKDFIRRTGTYSIVLKAKEYLKIKQNKC